LQSYFGKFKELVDSKKKKEYKECLGINYKETVEGFNMWYSKCYIFEKQNIKYVNNYDFESILLCGGALISSKCKRCPKCDVAFKLINRNLRYQK